MNHGCREVEEIQTKGINNIFNRIIAENFPKLKKESPRYRNLTEHQTICQDQKETLPDTF
jgi:hypothetical protein